MQTVTLSEFCRIVKKVSKENKGKLILGILPKKYLPYIWYGEPFRCRSARMYDEDNDLTELEEAGLDSEELEFMNVDEKREVLEAAGLDSEEFDF